MKKLLLLIFLLFSSFVFNGVTISNAEQNLNEKTPIDIMLEKRITEMEKEMYMKALTQYIEFDAEIIIPDYFDSQYVEYTFNLSDTLDIPARTTFRLIYRESCFRDTIVSSMGAKGLMQLMPDTRSTYYDLLRVDTLHLDNNQEDIYIGLNMLKDLYGFWVSRGNSKIYSWKLALASYNAGKGKVIYYKGIPPYKETTDFINFILKSHSNPQFFANYSKKYEDGLKNKS